MVSQKHIFMTEKIFFVRLTIFEETAKILGNVLSQVWLLDSTESNLAALYTVALVYSWHRIASVQDQLPKTSIALVNIIFCSNSSDSGI